MAYQRLHRAAERAMQPWLSTLAGLDFAARCRTPLFGAAAVGAPMMDHPVLGSRSEALGLLYVMEGSTLGGRMIVRSLAERGVDVTGLRFLDPYGAETGARWRGFLAVLEREVGEEHGRFNDAARGASKGFRLAEECLREREPA
jgi:heme oxygenase